MKNLRITLLTVFSFLFLSAFTLIALEHYEVTQDFSLNSKAKIHQAPLKKWKAKSNSTKRTSLNAASI